MSVKTQLVIFELLGGIFGWAWILSSIAAIYFLIAALFFHGVWANFFYVALAGIIMKWLTRGLLDNKERVIIEEHLIKNGISAKAAGKAWVTAYNNGGREMARRLMNLPPEQIKTLEL